MVGLTWGEFTLYYLMVDTTSLPGATVSKRYAADKVLACVFVRECESGKGEGANCPSCRSHGTMTYIKCEGFVSRVDHTVVYGCKRCGRGVMVGWKWDPSTFLWSVRYFLSY